MKFVAHTQTKIEKPHFPFEESSLPPTCSCYSAEMTGDPIRGQIDTLSLEENGS